MKKAFLVSIATMVLTLVPAAGAFASSYNGTTVTPASDGKTYTVNASAGDVVNLAGIAGSSSSQIALTFKNNVSGTIVITESANRPASASSTPTGTINDYFDVTLNGLSNNDISSSTWTFTVSNDWLKQNSFASTNVFLEHFNGTSWDRLSTKPVSSTATTSTLSASVTSFSPFAIVGVPGLVNTGSPYMVGAILSAGALIVIGGALLLSRRQKA